MFTFNISFSYNWFDSYYILFYSIQKYISSLLFSLDTLGNSYLILCVFFLGLFTVFTPCLVSLLPLVFSYVNSKQNDGLNIYIFIIGIITSIVFFIISTNLLNFSFIVYKLPIFSYILLFIISLNLMEVLIFSEINPLFEKYLNNLVFQNSLFQSYLMGLIIGSSALPCNTSLLLILNFILQKTNSMFFTFLYLVFYFFGFSLPLLFISTIQLSDKNFFIFSFIWKFILPLTGSFIFIFSCFSLLKIIFI
uniref:Thiol:disulfide interchange protein n=1 Tax=Herposiphonia versicolor TaxID=2007163 RepID=A0A1Z1MF33_9FLOR|nr:thiol:disulfide interchange protein [Herposiphonia versicolor]ARW64698.1 thiol:disulfide interchange protein [Herposiphonia versicolor]